MSDEPEGSGNSTTAEEVETAFEATVEEGVRRLERSASSLLATGVMGGIDVSLGVFGLMLVQHYSGNNKLLGALAFSIGFIALVLGRSELFTENFLVPIAPVVTGRKAPTAIARLWGGTAVANLAGGWVFAAVMMSGYSSLKPEAVKLGAHFVELGFNWHSFAVAMLGGAIITLMTWMIESSDSVGGKLVAAIVAGFLLTAGEINHCIVASLEMFAALVAGAPFGYLDWFKVFVWAAMGNILGGVGLVTILRIVQAGREPIERQQEIGRRERGERRR